MKAKNLRKKIRRLEKRLREGPTKLAKLKRKLETAKTKRKKPAGSSMARRGTKKTSPAKKTELRILPKTATKAPAPRKPVRRRKAKRTLNLSPERRAELAATMRARWAAKRAANGGPSPNIPQQ